MILYYYLDASNAAAASAPMSKAMQAQASAATAASAGPEVNDVATAQDIPSPETRVRFIIQYKDEHAQTAEGAIKTKDYYVAKSDIEKDRRIYGHEWMTQTIEAIEAIETMQESGAMASEEYMTIRPEMLISPPAFEQIIHYLKTGSVQEDLPPVLHNDLLEVSHYFMLSHLEKALSRVGPELLPLLKNLRKLTITNHNKEAAIKYLSRFKKLKTLGVPQELPIEMVRAIGLALPILLSLEKVFISVDNNTGVILKT